MPYCCPVEDCTNRFTSSKCRCPDHPLVCVRSFIKMEENLPEDEDVYPIITDIAEWSGEGSTLSKGKR